MKKDNIVNSAQDNGFQEGAEGKSYQREKLYILRPLQGRPLNKKPIAAFDVETHHVRNDILRRNGVMTPAWDQVFTLGAVVWDDNFRVFHEKEKMADFLLSRTFRNHYIFATNLEFDMGILYPDMYDRFKIIYRHCLKGAFYSEDRKENKNNVEYKRQERWTFADTRNYLPASVERLGKIVGVPKISPPESLKYSVPECPDELWRKPESKDEWRELAEYCLNDAKISYLFAKNFQQFCTAHNMKMQLTLPSCGIDFWRRNYQKVPMVREPEWMLKKHFLGSFRGGMTVMYKRGTAPSNIYAYDKNSAYPAAMVAGTDGHGTYPDPSTYAHKFNPKENVVDIYDGISDATVNMPYIYCPPIGVRQENGRLVFPIGKFRGWFTHIELQKAKEIGATVTPHESIFYRGTFVPFRDAAIETYRMRMEYGKTHHHYDMVKNLANSGLFGRWGMNFMKMEDIMSGDALRFDENSKAYMVNGNKRMDIGSFILRDFPNGKSVCIVERQGRPQKTSFPILAEYTTAICRLDLWQTVKDYSDYLVYSDTDSAFMTKPVFESDDRKLGAFKLEKTSSESLFLALKTYRTDEKCRSKGVGKYMNTKEKFDTALMNRKCSTTQWLRLKSAWAHNRPVGTILAVKKNLKLDDTKRNWNGQLFDPDDWQDSSPLRLR